MPTDQPRQTPTGTDQPYYRSSSHPALPPLSESREPWYGVPDQPTPALKALYGEPRSDQPAHVPGRLPLHGYQVLDLSARPDPGRPGAGLAVAPRRLHRYLLGVLNDKVGGAAQLAEEAAVLAYAQRITTSAAQNHPSDPLVPVLQAPTQQGVEYHHLDGQWRRVVVYEVKLIGARP